MALLLVAGSTRGSLCRSPRVLAGVLKSELSLSELPPTMLPNENDGTGEETGDEMSQKKVTRARWEVQERRGELPWIFK